MIYLGNQSVGVVSRDETIVEPLKVTENGVYTPTTGHAYAPINVDIPLNIPIEISDHINPITGEWERPSEWPNLDILVEQIVNDEDCAYFTYDLTKTPDYGWIGMYVETFNRLNWIIERGTIVNNAFVSLESFSVASHDCFRQTLDSANGNIQLWRITSTDHIKTWGFVTNTSTQASNFLNSCQPCVERGGTFPWYTTFYNYASVTPSNKSYITIWLEKDALVIGNKTSVSGSFNAWYNAYSLQSLDLSRWDTSNWDITSLGYCFRNCYSLQKVNMSYWDVSNFSLTTISNLFSCCYNLKKLDLSAWDTSNWAITDFSACWSNCYSLQQLDISNWKTNNWEVTNLGSCWGNCYSLLQLDLSGWDTSNWAVTNIQNCWLNCLRLTNLDVSTWDTSNWSITTLQNVWNSCQSLQQLDISDWDFSDCVLTSIQSCWYNCYSLQMLPIENWDTSKWELTTLANAWGYCYSLKELDFTNWDFSKWSITSIQNCFNGCYNLEKLLGVNNWNFVADLSSNTSTPFSFKLKFYNGLPLSINHSYADATMLTPASLANILIALPTVSSSKTITLGQTNKLKLTAAQIAVATQKGWTVA